jgi:lysozyme|tara:strand:+ start:1293 stop:1754 length:462 start_codon:yes stop_codon:yes gene_type:complete
MNIDELREEIKRDEGSVNSVYLDHLNLPTCGIGHLITEWDEEYNKPVGTTISEDRVKELFAKDIEITISECKELFDTFDNLPEEVQKICANMMFNMGRPRLSKFVKFREAISKSDWLECAIQMEDSRWHKQVTKRADRLIKRMEDLGVKEQVA